MKRVAVTLALTLLAACAPVTQRVKIDDAALKAEERKQSEIALKALLDEQVRLYRVGYPLVTRAHSLCGDKVRNIVGVYFASRGGLPQPLRDAAGSAGIGMRPKAFHVVPGAPADRAGLKPGDEMVKLNEWSVPESEDAFTAAFQKFDEITRAGPFEMTVQRGGEPVTLKMTPEKACDYAISLAQNDAINAFADGRRVIITRGMLRFVRDDTELALVVAHELAHNAMKHMDARLGNTLLGTIIDALFATRGVNTQGAFGNLAGAAFSQDFEAEADYVGLYMVALAGLDIENAPYFWRRMAAANPGSIRGSMMATHPATPERMLALEKTVWEIKEKKAKGLPLAPERRK